MPNSLIKKKKKKNENDKKGYSQDLVKETVAVTNQCIYLGLIFNNNVAEITTFPSKPDAIKVYPEIRKTATNV